MQTKTTVIESIRLTISDNSEAELHFSSTCKAGDIGHRLVVTCVKNGVDSTCILKEDQARFLFSELQKLYK
jgi:hypothetical protein